jgi:hypothetical protein
MWVDPQGDPGETGEQPVGEKETRWDYLRRYRLTFAAHQEAVSLSARLLKPADDLKAAEASRCTRIRAGHPFCLCWG